MTTNAAEVATIIALLCEVSLLHVAGYPVADPAKRSRQPHRILFAMLRFHQFQEEAVPPPKSCFGFLQRIRRFPGILTLRLPH